MKILIAFLAMLCLAWSIPVAEVPKAELSKAELEKCDPDPCPADEEEDVPSLKDSEEVTLTADETQEVSKLEANETSSDLMNVDVEYNRWSGFLNGWDKPVQWCYNCKRTALDGIYSVHNNQKEDRRWQYHAQTYPRGMLAARQWWSKWTGLRKTFNMYRADAAVVTIASVHNNAQEDRRFRFLFRKINAAAWKKKSWRWTGTNKYDGVLKKECGTGWVMGVWSSYSKAHNDRRFNLLCGWIVRKVNPVKPKAAWVTNTKSVAKSTTVTNSVSVTRKK